MRLSFPLSDLPFYLCSYDVASSVLGDSVELSFSETGRGILTKTDTPPNVCSDDGSESNEFFVPFAMSCLGKSTWH